MIVKLFIWFHFLYWDISRNTEGEICNIYSPLCMWSSPRCYHFRCNFSVRFFFGGELLNLKKPHWLATCISKLHKRKQTNLFRFKISSIESLLSISYPGERFGKILESGFFVLILHFSICNDRKKIKMLKILWKELRKCFV